MRIAVKDLRKHLRAHDCRLIFRLRQVDERSAAQTFERVRRERRVEHHVGDDRERRVEVFCSRNKIN